VLEVPVAAAWGFTVVIGGFPARSRGRRDAPNAGG